MRRLAASALLVAGGCGMAVETGPRADEPQHEGRALSHWVGVIHDGGTEERERGVDALHAMSEIPGSLMLPAIDALCDVVREPGDATETRRKALWAAWRISTDPDVDAGPLVPCFMAGLAAHDPQLQGGAAIILGEIGSAASDAVPSLRTLVNDPNPVVARYVRWALTRIDPE